MKECNNKYTSELVYNLFVNKLKEFKFLGERKWGDPVGISISDTYEIENHHRILYCTAIKWVKAGSPVVNRAGIMATLPNTNLSESLGHTSEIVIPYEFSRIYNTRAYEQNGIIEVRSYGKFTVGRCSLKKADFFDFVRETKSAEILIDEEDKQYVKVFEIKHNCLSKEEFASSLIDFTYMVKAFKDKYKDK